MGTWATSATTAIRQPPDPDAMSHVPLLAKHTVPKLQSPRRGPQVLFLCMVTAVVFLLVPQNAYAPFLWNATHVGDEPPAAVGRIVKAATQHQFVEDDLFQDLLATVSYLAQRDLGLR